MNRPQLSTNRIARAGPWASDPARHCAPGKIQPEAFFPEGRAEYSAAPALQACQWCPVQQPCRDYALAHPGLHGVWGGLTQADRDRIHRLSMKEGT